MAPKLRACDDGAERRGPVRVVSWNIKAGQEQGLDANIQLLKSLKADVILLQELDVNYERSGREDQPKVIASALGHEYAFAPALAFKDGVYGIATLSRLPFASVTTIPLSNQDVGEPRVALDTTLCVGSDRLRIVNHHADYVLSAAETSVEEIVNALRDDLSRPTILGGDLNQTAGALGVRTAARLGFSDLLAELDSSATFRNRRIDYLLGSALQAVDGGVSATKASDHQALWVVVELLE